MAIVICKRGNVKVLVLFANFVKLHYVKVNILSNIILKNVIIK